jgi:hypothetical protein
VNDLHPDGTGRRARRVALLARREREDMVSSPLFLSCGQRKGNAEACESRRLRRSHAEKEACESRRLRRSHAEKIRGGGARRLKSCMFHPNQVLMVTRCLKHVLENGRRGVGTVDEARVCVLSGKRGFRRCARALALLSSYISEAQPPSRPYTIKPYHKHPPPRRIPAPTVYHR